MKLHQQIKKARIDSGLTQKEMANKIGVDRNTVYRFEAGHNGIGYYVLEKMVDVLGMELTKKQIP